MLPVYLGKWKWHFHFPRCTGGINVWHYEPFFKISKKNMDAFNVNMYPQIHFQKLVYMHSTNEKFAPCLTKTLGLHKMAKILLKASSMCIYIRELVWHIHLGACLVYPIHTGWNSKPNCIIWSKYAKILSYFSKSFWPRIIIFSNLYMYLLMFTFSNWYMYLLMV